VSLTRLCRLFGITRQSYYQHCWELSDISVEHSIILNAVRGLRKLHPVMGGRKLYCLLQPVLLSHQIKIGRDALFDLLSAHQLLVKKKRRSVRTTWSNHWLKKYPNLIKSYKPQRPGQLWVADITYVTTPTGFLYLSLITDVYSHRIMGYHIAPNLQAVHCVKALQMALNHSGARPLIHHSDRGIQYCSAEYVSLLSAAGIKISMTESGDPLENPLAERVNGIIKNEYLVHYKINNYLQARRLLRAVITRYNNQRPHESIKMLTPEVVHQQMLLVNRTWSRKRTLAT
jgi:transposase InsO family protein